MHRMESDGFAVKNRIYGKNLAKNHLIFITVK